MGVLAGKAIGFGTAKEGLKTYCQKLGSDWIGGRIRRAHMLYVSTSLRRGSNIKA
jgi:hypothetical protein